MNARNTILILLTSFLISCSEKHVDSIYYCPMHPTYTTTHPGDCPICGMSLVLRENPTAQPKQEISASHYACPMHPEVQSEQPSSCPICGMDLVPTAQSTPEEMSSVQIDRHFRQLAGIQTQTATTGTIESNIRTVGSVRADERRTYRVNAKIQGWIESLSADYTGKFIRKGETLFSIYSPELLAAQEEFLSARATAARLSDSSLSDVRDSAIKLVSSSRRRLELWDVSAPFISQLEQDGQPKRTIPFPSPVSGYLMEKNIVEGQQITPQDLLFSITDLSQVWVEADFYEYEAQLVQLGQAATIQTQTAAQPRSAKVSYLYPTLNSQTRTLRVRFDLANPDLLLKPGMFVDVLLHVKSSEGVIVPDSAILSTGTRELAFVQSEPGIFQPRDVVVALRRDGKALIQKGIRDGESVVTHGNFLLDSESRLRTSFEGATLTNQPQQANPTSGTPNDQTSQPAGHQH